MIAANGDQLQDGSGHLRTCSLRCAGIYGEGETRHLPRIVVSVGSHDHLLIMCCYIVVHSTRIILLQIW